MSSKSGATGFTPPRSLILATPAGTYLMIRLAPELGWSEAAGVGALVLLLILCGPVLLRAALKERAIRAAEKKRKAEANRSNGTR